MTGPWRRFGIALDHLVVAAASLEAGAQWLERRLGVAPDPGGSHPGWGTHNRLMQLGAGTYLELIAADPAVARPPAPRPFGLDRPEMQARIAERPRLIHYVMRTPRLDDAAPAMGYDPGVITPMTRGALRWRITLPVGGMPGGDGLLPTLIQWDIDLSSAHPAAVLEPRGIWLERLTLRAPAPVAAQLAGIDSDPRIALHVAVRAGMTARLLTPTGAADLD